MRNKMQKRCLVLAVAFIKYFPVVSCLLFVGHALLALFGYHDTWLDLLAVMSIPRGVFMIICSIAFGFCRLHRLFVYYNIVCSIMMLLNDRLGALTHITTHRIIAVTWGVGLLVTLAIRWRQFNRDSDVKRLIGGLSSPCCR